MFPIAPKRDELQVNKDSILKKRDARIVAEEKYQMRRTVTSTKTNKGATYLTGPNDHKKFTQNAAIITHQKNEIPPHIATTSPQVSVNYYGYAGVVLRQNHMISHHQQHAATYHSVQPIKGKQIQTRPTNSFTRESLQSERNRKFEFNNLNDSRNVSTLSFHSGVPNGEACGRHSTDSFKKVNRSHGKNIFKSEQDYDKIVVDLSALRIRQDGRKALSPVLRLFSCFRKLHNVLAEVPPYIQPYTGSAYEPTFALVPNFVMPDTMNVRYQIKYASRKLNKFFSNLLQIVDNNPMYKELYQYLLNQQQLVSEFDIYKGLELEHKGGEFVSEDMREYAEGLEIVLERLTKSLREVNLRIVAFNVDIGNKYHNGKDVRRTVERPKTNFDTKAKKHSTNWYC